MPNSICKVLSKCLPHSTVLATVTVITMEIRMEKIESVDSP